MADQQARNVADEQPGTATWAQAVSDTEIQRVIAPLVAPRRVGAFEAVAKNNMPGKVIGRVALVDRASGTTVGYLPVYSDT